MAKSDPNAVAIAALMDGVNKLQGQVAALIAFVGSTSKPLADRDLMGVKGLSQRLAPHSIATLGKEAPALTATLTVDRLQEMAAQLDAIRKSGEAQ